MEWNVVKVNANGAWDDMLLGIASSKTEKSVANNFSTIFGRHKRSGDRCNCGPQPQSCPPGPPGPKVNIKIQKNFMYIIHAGSSWQSRNRWQQRSTRKIGNQWRAYATWLQATGMREMSPGTIRTTRTKRTTGNEGSGRKKWTGLFLFTSLYSSGAHTQLQDGLMGLDGEQGEDGAEGEPGPAGPPGFPGIPGQVSSLKCKI